MRRQLIGIVAIACGKCEDGLFGFHLVKRRSDIAERNLSAAHKSVEVKDDRLHPVVGRRGIERGDDVAQPVFLGLVTAAQGLRRADG